MIIETNRFNIYFLSLALLTLAAGCRTSDPDHKKKEHATLRVHLEVVPESMDFSTSVPVYRAKPVMVTIDKAPFLTEANVASAKVVDIAGGYDLQIKFDRQGTWLFEEYTTTNPDRHLAIFTAFGNTKKKKARWLAAPLIRGRISNGTLTFAPDATREESEEIAAGLNNLAKKRSAESKW